VGSFLSAIVGGNCNNDLHVGAFAVNLNNAFSNTNWNIGASLSYQCRSINQARHSPTPQAAEMRLIKVKIKPITGAGQ
jgi:hypothetical protein